MRTTRDRIRHAVLFELVALVLVAPAGAVIFGVRMSDFGVIAIVSTTIAMAWNYAYNLIFDRLMLRLAGDTRKTLPARVAHAVLFEVGLLVLLVPFIAWFLGVSFWHAFVIDASLAVFYMLYAFAFNWLYDVLFPIPAPGGSGT